jgi:hypothetical protein
MGGRLRRASGATNPRIPAGGPWPDPRHSTVATPNAHFPRMYARLAPNAADLGSAR